VLELFQSTDARICKILNVDFVSEPMYCPTNRFGDGFGRSIYTWRDVYDNDQDMYWEIETTERGFKRLRNHQYTDRYLGFYRTQEQVFGVNKKQHTGAEIDWLFERVNFVNGRSDQVKIKALGKLNHFLAVKTS